MRKEHLNGFDILRKQLFDFAGRALRDAAERLRFKLLLQTAAYVFECAECRMMRYLQPLHIQHRVQYFTQQNPADQRHGILQRNALTGQQPVRKN